MENDGKIRLLRLLELLQTQSDEQHPISTPDAIRLLKERWGLDAYRITVQRDVEALIAAGYDVRTIHARQNRYYLATRPFEQAELKLLTDAVASSKFITASKSNALAEKIAGLTNIQRADELKRNISIADRIKPKNEGIYAYRVLLTRAGSGMVICVPEGNANKTATGFWEDSTRLPEYYDGTYQYLKSLGIEEI